MGIIQGNPPVKRWLLEKSGRDAWYTYYREVMQDAVKDGWKATEC